MKKRIALKNTEVELAADEFIVSKTDLSGRITYINRTFMRIANYCEAELLHRQHNVIRHPDMPRGVFRLLWNTLKDGKEFTGYVKNLTADGACYWVFANVTPDVGLDGRINGYFSVRRRPGREAIAVIEPIYKAMLEVEHRFGPAHGPDESVKLLRSKLDALGTTYEEFVFRLNRPEE